MEKIKRLTPNQGIKFKLIIRNNENLNSGSLKISLAPTQEVDEPESPGRKFFKSNLAQQDVTSELIAESIFE